MKIATGCVRLLAVVALTAALSCDGDDDGEAVGPTTTSDDVTTTTTGPTTTTMGPTTTTAPGLDLVRCTNAENFSVGYPRSWVERECSQFHREPFESPGATDERVAAITAYVDPVPFDVATELEGAQDVERTTLEIDGYPAVRLSYETGPDSALYPPGTPITFYAVDLPAGPDGRARTLFVDTVGLPGFAYEENVEVLDRMAPTVDFTGS